MKGLLSIALLCAALPLFAQHPADPGCIGAGKEPPRSRIVAYPTPSEARAALEGKSKYLQPLDSWETAATDEGTLFTAEFIYPFAWLNRQILLHVGSAPSSYTVSVNGKTVGYTQTGSTPTEFNLTKYASEGKNKIAILVHDRPASAVLESWPRTQTPALVDTYVQSQPTIRIRDVETRTSIVEGRINAEIVVAVRTGALNPKSARIQFDLLTPAGESAATGHKDIALDMRREDTLRFIATIPAEMLWSAEKPTLYTLLLSTRTEGRITENIALKVGFRTVDALPDGRLFINGKHVELRPVDLPASLDEESLWTLKMQGYNTLRLPAGPVSPDVFALCDQAGCYVVRQTPINSSASGTSIRRDGNPSNDPQWGPAYIARAEESYHTAKLHPSVIAFSIAEQSANGINLYESYLRMKELEDSRPILYPDAGGEWNSDPLPPLTEPAPRPSAAEK